ncbi:MAG: N-acetylmuramoyl-L-alanine amidase [Geminicoccaceae bacterium]
MRAARLLLLLILVTLDPASGLSRPAVAATSMPQATGLRFGGDSARTRIVLEADRSFTYSLRTDAEPPRLLVELPQMLWNLQPDPLSRPRGLVRAQRLDTLPTQRLQLVIEASRPIRVAASELLSPSNDSRHYRLVVEIEPAAAAPAAPPEPIALPPDLPVIVLDAGHGGVDPGAIGVDGTQEKAITLAMARRLRTLLEESGRYRVVLTRDSDVFLPLRERLRLAREADGDLFVSLHADAIGKQHTRGASVYTLSETASDEEAARLAATENKADIIAGTDLSGTDDVVASILIDLAQRDTKNKSIQFADILASELAQVTPLLRRHRRFAGFAVLKSPDVPSVLIELGYISNTEDARNLGSAAYRDKLAAAVVAGIDRYFAQLKS